MQSAPPPSPGTGTSTLRWGLTLAAIVGFQVGLAAVFDAQEALRVDETAIGQESQFAKTGYSPELQRAIALAGRSGYQSAITAMLPWRVGTEALLALAGGAVFFFSLRLRVASEERARIAENLGRAAFGAAVLRTIEGAQSLVIARRVSQGVAEAFRNAGTPDGPINAAAAESGMPVASVLWSIVVIALFMGLGHYFRSERVQNALG